MGMRFWLRPLLAVVTLSAGMALANASTVPPTSEHWVKHVQSRKAAAYRDVLASFDAAMAGAPEDASIAVTRCSFISNFTDEEYESLDSALADFEACSEAIKSRWPDAPVAQMFAFEQLWGEEAVEQGEKLLAGAGAWPAVLRRELLSGLSQAQEHEENTARAGELAVMAARLGEATRVPIAVKHLAERKEYAAAASLLGNASPATEQWEAKQRVEAAMALPDRLAALKELRRYAGAKFEVSATVAAGAYLRAGDIAMARKLLKGEDGEGPALQQVRFDVALAANDLEAAVKLVDMTDTQTMGTNLERFAVLATRSPLTLLSAPMMLAALICLAMLAFFALLPGLLMVPFHYRGLVRRVRGKAALPLFDAIGLRHAWLGAAVVLSVPLIVGALVEPGAMVVMLGGESVPDAVGLARIMLWGTVAGLLCVIPLVRSMGRRHLIGDRATFRASWRVLLAWACLVGTALLLGLWNGHTGGGGETMHTKSMAALAIGGREIYGPLVTMLLVAVLVPIFEELTFRGLILGGLSRHISFGWANTLQALLFAASHDDLPRFPFYLVLGLLAGWLVKKTGSLGPAIALHVLNNAMAFSLRML